MQVLCTPKHVTVRSYEVTSECPEIVHISTGSRPGATGSNWNLRGVGVEGFSIHLPAAQSALLLRRVVGHRPFYVFIKIPSSFWGG
jgi:hypothetical protein